MLNAKGFVSAGYILEVETFDQTVKYNKHEDMNLTAGLLSLQNNWQISAFARNMLEARPSYNAEFDVIPDGLAAVHLSPGSFRQIGVKFENFFD